MRQVIFLLVIVLLFVGCNQAGLPTPAKQEPTTDPLAVIETVEHKLLTSCCIGNRDYYGYSVAISGSTAVVGTRDTNSVYIFTRTSTTWTQQAVIKPDDNIGSNFGYSVAISGNTIAVGAPSSNFTGAHSGAVYIFTHTNNTWTQQARFTASDNETMDRFGSSVAIKGNHLLVGASTLDVIISDPAANDSGAAYIFTYQSGSWVEQAKLVPNDSDLGDQFGHSVAFTTKDSDIDTIIVGAWAKTNRTGAAYVFTNSGNDWTQQAKFTASDGTEDDEFGYSVAISGDAAIVGAPIEGDTGSAYIFARTGTSWAEQAKITTRSRTRGNHFGQSVSIRGDTAAVGVAHLDNKDRGRDSGAVYIYKYISDSWRERGMFVASDAVPDADGDNFEYFGGSVDFGDNAVIVGAIGGAPGYSGSKSKKRCCLCL